MNMNGVRDSELSAGASFLRAFQISIWSLLIRHTVRIWAKNTIHACNHISIKSKDLLWPYEWLCCQTLQAHALMHLCTRLYISCRYTPGYARPRTRLFMTQACSSLIPTLCEPVQISSSNKLVVDNLVRACSLINLVRGRWENEQEQVVRNKSQQPCYFIKVEQGCCRTRTSL